MNKPAMISGNAERQLTTAGVPQAMQLTFLTFLPSIYLSGLLFPIEGMPTVAQYLSATIPLTYFLRIVCGIVLKGGSRWNGWCGA